MSTPTPAWTGSCGCGMGCALRRGPAPGPARGPRRAPRASARLFVALACLLVLGVLLTGCGGSQGGSAGQGARATSSSTAGGGVGSGLEPGSTDPASGLTVVALSSLPSQVAETVRLVQAGGPYPYQRDGVTYHNNNRVLPQHPDGYYHEYTVKTPGSSTRGARRVIHGQGDEYFYTADHYASFRRIA